MNIPGATVTKIRSHIAAELGMKNTCQNRLSKEILVRLHFELRSEEPPRVLAVSDVWQWSDYDRRKAIATLAGFEYDPPKHSPRSFNMEELYTITEEINGK